MSLWIWLPIVLVVGGIAAYAVRPSHAYLRHRTPDRERWQRLYPDGDPNVMTTLKVIGESFGLRPDDIYRLEPDDRLYDIYSAAYRLQGVDALEFESLAQTLVDRFGISEDRIAQLGSATVSDVLAWTHSALQTPRQAMQRTAGRSDV